MTIKRDYITVAMWVAYGLLAFVGGDLHTLWVVPAILVLGFVATLRTLKVAR